MHYQIFLPGVIALNFAAIGAAGLEQVIGTEGMPTSFMPNGHTPFDKQGLILTWGDSKLNPDWEWVKVGDKYWVGWDKLDPPSPTDLKRSKIYAGVDVELALGRKWHVPHYRKLEHTMQLDAAGEIVRSIDPKYDEFVQRCDAMMIELFSGLDLLDYIKDRSKVPIESEELKTIRIVDGLYLAVDALAFNYRLNSQIAVAMGLLDDDSVRRILANIVELPSIILERDEQIKKKDSVSDVDINVMQPS